MLFDKKREKTGRIIFIDIAQQYFGVKVEYLDFNKLKIRFKFVIFCKVM